MVRLLCLSVLLSACGGAVAPEEDPRWSTFRCKRDRHLKAEEFRKLRPSALPDLKRVLSNFEEKGCWRSALSAAGYLGGEAGHIIQNFIKENGSLLALGEDAVLVQSAFDALGLLVREAREPLSSRSALDFLLDSCSPLELEKKKIAQELDSVIRKELIRVMARAAVKSLALSQHEEGQKRLLELGLNAVDQQSFEFQHLTVAAEEDVIYSLFNIHVIPTGRALFALNDTINKAYSSEELLKEKISEVRALAQKSWKMEREWFKARQGKAKYKRAVFTANRVADARLAGLHGQLESLRKLLDEPEDNKDIDEVEAIIFPTGPHALMSSPHDEQVQVALRRLKHLKEQKDEALKRLNLESHVQIAEKAHLEFRKELRSGEEGAGFEEVIEARAQLQMALRMFISFIVTQYPSFDATGRENRKRLLTPLLTQNRRLSDLLRRKMPISDIDPQTGQEIILELQTPSSP